MTRQTLVSVFFIYKHHNININANINIIIIIIIIMIIMMIIIIIENTSSHQIATFPRHLCNLSDHFSTAQSVIAPPLLRTDVLINLLKREVFIHLLKGDLFI